MVNIPEASQHGRAFFTRCFDPFKLVAVWEIGHLFGAAFSFVAMKHLFHS